MITEVLIVIVYLIINISTISYSNFVDKFIENCVLYFEENKKEVQSGIKFFKALKINENNKEVSFLNNSLEDYGNIKDSKKLLSGLINYNKLVYFGAFLIIFLSLFTIYCFWFRGFEKTVLLIIIYLIFSYILEQIFIYQHKKYFPKLDTIHFNILLKIYRYRFKNKNEFIQLEESFIKVFKKNIINK
jgi:hypothetical protein